MTLPQLTATGNIGQDPELKFTANGQAVLEFSIGCNENKRNPTGEWETISTTWLRVTLWGQEAQRGADLYKKGDHITVTGSLHVREYTRQDGSKGSSPEVKYATVSLPRIREDRNQTTQPATPAGTASAWETPTQTPAQQAPAATPAPQAAASAWGSPPPANQTLPNTTPF